ncbi:MAG: phospho-N-acetylmuramoyl-pentapeptide-transferase [Oscillospiraceae bacterium]|jgi:phospho-N-acetylmuramoyl-pentapeptide-transferase|nr:phospho-N-acetylmuramoyl-pentapeptide-transferase [Oscillospiraceae bacterium]
MENGIWALTAAAISFAIAALLGKKLIPFLHKIKFGQKILEIGPNWHKAKEGTPTMGGLMFIAAIIVTTICVFAAFLIWFAPNSTSEGNIFRQQVFVLAGLGLALLNGAIGFIDDYTKIAKKQNKGLTAMQKLILQFLTAAAYVAVLAFCGFTTATTIPFLGEVDVGFLYYIIAVLVIVGVINAVNLTDGIDGLCGSLTFFAAIFVMLIASVLHFTGLIIMSAALAGGCLGFLVWNFYPAKVFMGDTGSLFLGGMLCGLAFATGCPVLLLPLAIVYLCEMGSVVLQVLYFKATKGKRLFKMSPIHHHFEMCGWNEVKITTVFSLVGIVFGAGSLALVIFGT